MESSKRNPYKRKMKILHETTETMNKAYKRSIGITGRKDKKLNKKRPQVNNHINNPKGNQ